MNPFFEPWSTPFELPPFDAIEAPHYEPAFEAALKEHRAEIDAIIAAPPSFANTIEGLERAGAASRRVGNVFYNVAGTMSDDALRAVERTMAPVLARHRSAIMLDPRLFARVDAVFTQRATLGLNAEQQRLLERVHKGFVRAGARLDEAQRGRLAEITARLATLGTQFAQNVLADENEGILLVNSASDLDGLSPDFIMAAAALATTRGHDGRYAVSLSRGNVEAFLTSATRRDLRESLFAQWIARGENGGATDNRGIIAETLRLRAERAQLLGYDSYAHYKLDDTMAETPDAVRDLLDRVWEPGRARARSEQVELQALANAEGTNGALAPHDWRFYAERLRHRKYAINDAELRPYFPLDAMIAAAFDTAGRLFGLTFAEVTGLPAYHPDVRAFDVRDREGRHVALFLGDYFARPSKRSGAWMSAFRTQKKLDGDTRPIIVNVLNIAKPAEGAQAVLSIDEARTLFHEFGHALHGMLSDVTYASLAGTAVSADFVELPSQLFEHWLTTPQVLSRFARHAETGEALPDPLIARLRAARTFNQGFATVEYTSSALVDLDMHVATDAAADPMAFEAEVLARIQMPDAIVMRHRSPHFAHIFAGEGYAAGYYSYLWSEVLDADAFSAFEETGDIFDPATAERLRAFIYSAGNLRDAKAAYTAFRGRLPSVDALLRKRGLTGEAEA